MLRKIAFPSFLVLVALASIAIGTTFKTNVLLASGTGDGSCTGDNCGRIYLKSTSAGFPSSVIRWKDSTNANRWSIGNDSGATDTQDFWIFDNVNSAYTLFSSRAGTGASSSYLRFGSTDGRMSYDNTTHDWTIKGNAATRLTIADADVTTAAAVTLSESGVRVLTAVGNGLSKSGGTASINTTVVARAGVGSFLGQGSDGALAFDGSSVVAGITPSAGVYLLTRDLFATTISISDTVVVKFGTFRIFATGAVSCPGSGMGYFRADGNAGSNGSGASGGNGGTATAAATFAATIAGGNGSSTGGAGGVGSNQTAAPFGCTAGAAAAASSGAIATGGLCQGAAGGNDGSIAGGVGGTVTVSAATTGPYPQSSLSQALTGRGLSNVQVGMGTGGGGGRSKASGGGGGGGAGGAWGSFLAYSWTNPTHCTISANGGAGGNASSGGTGNGGGGGGGGGYLVIGAAVGALPTYTAAGGAGGSGFGTGVSGGTGGAGLISAYTGL